jgi:hypothetical protein
MKELKKLSTRKSFSSGRGSSNDVFSSWNYRPAAFNDGIIRE